MKRGNCYCRGEGFVDGEGSGTRFWFVAYAKKDGMTAPQVPVRKKCCREKGK